ncbi:MAG: hypothetical protein JSS57_17440 [Proteobacteria bacterium]|nr:hypothetical protein [Pseudomonadota bacterium]
MANLCTECLGRNFVYSPGGYAPKLPCPVCGKGPTPRAATVALSQRPEEVKAAQDRIREYAFDLFQPYINEGVSTPDDVHQRSCDLFTLINAATELAMLHASRVAEESQTNGS